MRSIKTTYKLILSDYSGKYPNIIKCIVAYYLNPSYSVLVTFRIGQYFFYSRNKLFKLISSRIRMRLIFKKNCDISYTAKIGKKFRFAHPLGIVIGAGSVIGDNVIIYQNVTLGSDGKDKNNKKYPTLKNNVILYPNTIVIGDVVVNENSTVGAGSFINIDVPPNSIAVGSPCKIIDKKP